MDATVEQLGTPERKRISEVWEEAKRFAATSEEEGQLFPKSVAADLLGISRQRISQLCQEATFTEFQFFGRVWLSGNEIVEFLKLERESGRPWNKPSVRELWRISREFARGK